MNLEKSLSHWEADGNSVRLGVPITKVDVEHRQVSGFATLDNIDQANDVVLADASARAFARFKGNIREMHQPIAAGRLVDFKEDSFYDSDTQKFYNGIYVTVYVSKGAEDTWQKVLDGTLSGFSIGGDIIEQSSDFVKDAGKVIRFIKDYSLNELSLVDNPCNQYSTVASVVKSVDGTFMKGMIADTEILNVFWCEHDEIAKASKSESETCLSCNSDMVLLDWFEKTDDAVAPKVAETVTKFLRQKEDNAVSKAEAIGEGGVNMADEVKKDADGVVTSGDVAGEGVVEGNVEEQGNEKAEAEREAEAAGEVLSEEEADKAAETDEAEQDPDFEKMFDDLKDSVTTSIAQTVEKVEKKVEEVTAAFDEKASKFEKSLDELSERLEAIKTEREDVEKRLDALESATAFKKSGEATETVVEPVTKSKKGFWSSTFFDSE